MIALNSKLSVKQIRDIFIGIYEKEEEFVLDRSGKRVIEIVGAQFIADEPTIFGELNIEYAQKELQWYYSMNLNVNAMVGGPPTQWLKTADSQGFVNSNYGWAVFHQNNGDQYGHVIKELMNNPYSRRAVMIYTRPQMWCDYNKDGRNDFMCTNDVQYIIRDNSVHSIVNMRSNDAIWGYKNDFFWQDHVHDIVVNSLQDAGMPVEKGKMIWNAGSLHIYDRHFNLIEEFIKNEYKGR